MYPEDALTGLTDSFNYSGQVDRIFLFIVGISVVLLALVTVLMIYFAIRYSRKRHPEGVNIEGNTLLEIIWTAVPTALVLAMFYYGWIGFKAMRNVPDNAMTVNATGQMWAWSFEYSNGRHTDTLYVPVGRPVKLEIASLDVIHSFYVPAFRVKEDAVPGAESYLWFVSENEGSFDVLCAEYCGTGHSSMSTKVVAMPEEEFRTWFNSWSPPPEQSGGERGSGGDPDPESDPGEESEEGMDESTEGGR